MSWVSACAKSPWPRLAAEGDDEGLAAEGVDVGRARPEPGDEAARRAAVFAAFAFRYVVSVASVFERLFQSLATVFSTLTRA